MTTLFRFKSKRKAKVSHGLDDDPFSTRPFPDESEEDNRQRMWALQEATRISREIDQSLLEAKKLLDKKKKATKILLLGRPLLLQLILVLTLLLKGSLNLEKFVLRYYSSPLLLLLTSIL